MQEALLGSLTACQTACYSTHTTLEAAALLHNLVSLARLIACPFVNQNTHREVCAKMYICRSGASFNSMQRGKKTPVYAGYICPFTITHYYYNICMLLYYNCIYKNAHYLCLYSVLRASSFLPCISSALDFPPFLH